MELKICKIYLFYLKIKRKLLMSICNNFSNVTKQLILRVNIKYVNIFVNPMLFAAENFGATHIANDRHSNQH